MRKIKLDPFTIALIVLVLLVVFALFGPYFNSAKARISELEEQIRHDLRILELSKERQEELAKKAVQAYRIIVTIMFGGFISLIWMVIIAGTSYIDALEAHLGTAGITLAMITVVFYNTWNPDVLLKVLRKKIKIWIYQKNGFDPTTIELLECRVKIHKMELEHFKLRKPR